MEKYRTRYDKIEKFEIIKETPQGITYKEERKNYMTGAIWMDQITESKESRYHKWHDTFIDAKNYLIKKKEDKIESAKFILERAYDELKIIEQIKEF